MKKTIIFACVSLVIYMWACLTFDWYSGVACVLWTIRLVYTKDKRIIVTSILVCIVAISRVVVINNTSRLSSSQTHFEMRVDSASIKIDGDLVSGIGYVHNELVNFSYKCVLEEDKYFFEQLEDNIIVSVKGQLKSYKTASFKHLFDEKKYYFQYKRSFYRLHIEQYSILKKELNVVLRWKKYISRTITGHLWQYINTLVFGQIDEKGYFETFNDLGVLFLFVFSGIHIKVLLYFIKYILLRVGFLRHQTMYILYGVSVLCIILYGLKIGILKQILFILFPKQSRLVLIGLLIIAVLIYNPFLLFHVAFHFSVLVSAMYYFIPKKQMFYSMLAVCISYHYFQLNVIGISLTLILSKVVQWVLLPIAWIGALLPHPLLNNCNSLLDYFYQFMTYISKLNSFIIVTGRQEFYWYTLFLIGTIILILQSYKKRHVIWYVMLYFLLFPKPTEQFMMIDVGQGDSLLFQSGYTVVMIDTGGTLSFRPKEHWRVKKQLHLSEFTTIPLLKSLGIKQIDAIICSHADSDHIGELQHIKEKVTVHQIISAKGAPVKYSHQVLANQKITVGNITFDVLYPFEQGDGKNEHSLVLLTNFLNKKWLLTGDIGEKSEQKIINKYPNLKVDILKVAHHGSKYSSSHKFIQHIQAKTALISVGENNRYNHPHNDILNRLKRINIYRTDKQGTIWFNGARWYITKENSQ